MNAKDALNITEQALSEKNAPVAGALAKIYKDIEATAKGGYRAFNLSLPSGLTAPQIAAIKSKLVEDGFKVKTESDQREGKTWTTVSW